MTVSPPDIARSKARRILIYTHALAGGGAERALSLLASDLVARGHEVTFATDYHSNENDIFLDPAVRRPVLHRNHALTTWRLSRLIAREKPDITLSGLGASNLKHALAALLAGRAHRAIISYHGFFDGEPKLLSRLSFVLTPVLTRLVARTVAVSHALRDNLIGTWFSSRSRTRYIQNPVYFGRAFRPPNEADLRKRANIVLACGRLAPTKNFSLLLRAFALVKPRDARLVIIGEGAERPLLETEIRRLGLIGRVEMPGYIKEPWAYYAHARCMAVSSLTESFGMALVEAMAHGLPVVSTDCGGPREVLDNGRLGPLVGRDDEVGLASAITSALANPGDPAPRVRRAATYSRAAAADAYEGLFEEVIAGNGRVHAPSMAWSGVAAPKA